MEEIGWLALEQVNNVSDDVDRELVTSLRYFKRCNTTEPSLQPYENLFAHDSNLKGSNQNLYTGPSQLYNAFQLEGLNKQPKTNIPFRHLAKRRFSDSDLPLILTSYRDKDYVEKQLKSLLFDPEEEDGGVGEGVIHITPALHSPHIDKDKVLWSPPISTTSGGSSERKTLHLIPACAQKLHTRRKVPWFARTVNCGYSKSHAHHLESELERRESALCEIGEQRKKEEVMREEQVGEMGERMKEVERMVEMERQNYLQLQQQLYTEYVLLSEYNRTVQGYEVSIEEYKMRCEQQSREIQQLRDALNSACDQQILEQELLGKEKVITDLQQHVEMIESRHQVEMDNLHKTIQLLERDVFSGRDELAALQQSVTALTNQKTELESALRHSSHQISVLQARVSTLSSPIEIPEHLQFDMSKIEHLLNPPPLAMGEGGDGSQPLEKLQQCLKSLRDEMSVLKQQVDEQNTGMMSGGGTSPRSNVKEQVNALREQLRSMRTSEVEPRQQPPQMESQFSTQQIPQGNGVGWADEWEDGWRA